MTGPELAAALAGNGRNAPLTLDAAVTNVIATTDRVVALTAELEAAHETRREAFLRFADAEQEASAIVPTEPNHQHPDKCLPPCGTRNRSLHWIVRPDSARVVQWFGNEWRRYHETGLTDWSPIELARAGWWYVGPVATPIEEPTP